MVKPQMDKLHSICKVHTAGSLFYALCACAIHDLGMPAAQCVGDALVV